MFNLTTAAPKRVAGVITDSLARSKIASSRSQQISRRHDDKHLGRVFCTMAQLEDQTVGNVQNHLTGTRDLRAVLHTKTQIAGARRDVIGRDRPLPIRL
jgi:hypothetical protein